MCFYGLWNTDSFHHPFRYRYMFYVENKKFNLKLKQWGLGFLDFVWYIYYRNINCWELTRRSGKFFTSFSLTFKVSRVILLSPYSQYSTSSTGCPNSSAGWSQQEKIHIQIHEFEMQPFCACVACNLKKNAWVHPKCIWMTSPADVHEG